MAQVGRISGPLLTANLERNGIDLAFRNDLNTTQLLFLDVNNNKIGVNTSTPTKDLEVVDTTQTTNLIATTQANTPGFEITDSTFRVLIGDIYLNASQAIVMANMENGTIRISDNIISTISSNADIDLTPNGTGTTEVLNDLNVFGDIYTPGNITFDGTITFGDADTDNVTFETDVNSSIYPDQNNTYNLGARDKRWSTLFTNFVNGRAVEVDGYILDGVDLLTRHGGIIYVAQEGSDDNSGDHIQDPMATISAALSKVEASGDQPFTILVSPGEYQEALPLVVPANVSVIGQDIRNVVVTTDTSSQSEDVFHLNDKTLIANLTVRNHYYDSINNTGYAFRFAPDAVMTERSPYIQNVTVLTSETSDGAGDAGRGAWIDGSELNSASINATMLFHSCTFISPNADVINMTNGVRVEWLNSFTYYANRGLYAFNGVTGRTSYDGSTVEYGAELRSIGSANVYGTYGAVADGADTLMYLIQHNFGYIGAGNKSDNNEADVIQANEVVELNSGQIHFVSTDQQGNFRVGDNFFVDLETGNSSISIDTADVDSFQGLRINSPGGTTVVDGSYITTGNILLDNNTISTNVGDLNLESATGIINFNSNTNVDGNLDIRDNFTFGGTLNIAGDQPGRDTAADKLTFNVDFTQDFKPHVTLTHSLGEAVRPWSNAYLDRAEIDDITIDENYITTDVSNSNLDLRSTNRIYIPGNNVQIDNNLTVDGITNIQGSAISGTINYQGDRTQTGNYLLTNYNIIGNLDISSQAQFEEILFDGNVITTTTSNEDLELRANGTGRILVPDQTVQINNNLDVDNVFNNNNVNINLQTQFASADVSDIDIVGNYISTNNNDLNLELRANGTGIINVEDSVLLNQGLTVGTITRLQDGNTFYKYGPELIVNGTFDTNIDNWAQTGGGSANDVNGNLQIDATGSARNVSQEVTVEAGKTYEFKAQFRSVSNGNPFYLRVFESGVGTLFEWNETTGLVPDQELVFGFTAQTTAIDIIFRAVDTIVEWDNISLVEDIGIVTEFTPVEVDVTDVTQTGNTTQTGNITQTGNTVIDGNLSVSNEFTKNNINIDANIIQNTGEGLRIAIETNQPESIPRIVQAIAAGSTADDYAQQTEKNLINFLIDNNYADVNRNGSVTTSDYIEYLQYIANGTTGNAEYDNFISNVLLNLIKIEYATPGYFNPILLNGDYFKSDFLFKAAGTGKVVFSNPSVNLNKNISVEGTLFANSIVAPLDADILSNNYTVSNTIKLDDNTVSTIVSNANLEIRAFENNLIYVPSSDVTFDQNLTTKTDTRLDNTAILGDITHTGTRNQTGNLNIIGNVYATTSNIESEIQFDDISFDDNIITTTKSNADLDLRASAAGIISILENDVQIDTNISLGTLTSNTITVANLLSSEEFELSSDIKIFDNVIATTNSNSNLELRTADNSTINLQNINISSNVIETQSANINIQVAGTLNINSTGAINLPTGSTVQRQKDDSGIRLNTDDSVFEGFRNSNVITFNGLYSNNRQTNILAHPTNNNIQATVNLDPVVNINSAGLDTHGVDVDDVFINNNIIKTNVSNSSLDLGTSGTGSLVIDNIAINTNTLTNTVDSVFELNNTLYGKVKFVSTGAVRIPAGTDATRPVTPETGTTRWNTENELLEVWDGSTFITAAGTSATISAEEMDDLILEYTLIFG